MVQHKLNRVELTHGLAYLVFKHQNFVYKFALKPRGELFIILNQNSLSTAGQKFINISLFKLINFRIGNHLIYTSTFNLSSALETFPKLFLSSIN